MSENTPVLVGEDDGLQIFITCDYGAAIIMRIDEFGDTVHLSLNGETMDAICKAWLEYTTSGRPGPRKVS